MIWTVILIAWYLAGFIPLAIIAWQDWNVGCSFSLGEIIFGIFLACIGPLWMIALVRGGILDKTVIKGRSK